MAFVVIEAVEEAVVAEAIVAVAEAAGTLLLEKAALEEVGDEVQAVWMGQLVLWVARVPKWSLLQLTLPLSWIPPAEEQRGNHELLFSAGVL